MGAGGRGTGRTEGGESQDQGKPWAGHPGMLGEGVAPLGSGEHIT